MTGIANGTFGVNPASILTLTPAHLNPIMVNSPVLAQTIFASYFLLILLLFWIILNSLKQSANGLRATPRRAFVFVGLALGSLCHTWFYMIKFLIWSFREFESRYPVSAESVWDRTTRWLVGSELFEQAWRHVCEAPLSWWWSEQLCILTVGVWTAFLFVQGSWRRVPYVGAYMLLGQLVAISVASNLFFAAVILRRAQHDLKPPRTAGKTVPPGAYIPILLSHVTIMLSPTVARPDSKWFLPNLLAMHGLIVLPLFLIPSRPGQNPSRTSISSQTFYVLLAALALVPRAQTYRSLPVQGLSGLAQGAWTTLHAHPAQSSIGYDVIWTTASFAVYCAIARGLDVRRGVVGMISPGLGVYLDDQED